MDRKSLLCNIPKVDEILNMDKIAEIKEYIPYVFIVESVRKSIEDIRNQILNLPKEGIKDYIIDVDYIADNAVKYTKRYKTNNLKRVVNATGVIIHTNLGRSILCKDAIEAVEDVAVHYSNLEYDINEGTRGSRYSHIEDIIKTITGAEAAMVVNNNAAAVLLVLSTLCRGKEAIVSRGELVEIGGSFRIPEVMEQSGAILKEVGTTNKTHILDYEKAIGEDTGLILKVHTSNFKILGFTESVDRGDLALIGKQNRIPVFEDIGSGSFVDFSKYGLSYEPTVQESIKSGMDIVTFSGDKMLGGPQAGIIVGKKSLVDKMKKNPLTRAIRVDKMTIAALEATLKLYLDESTAINNIPTLNMITKDLNELESNANKLLGMLKTSIGDKAEIGIVHEYSEVGGGSMPLEMLPTYGVSIKPYFISPNKLEEKLRYAQTPIIARIRKNRILLDVRTISIDEYNLIRDALVEVL